MGWQDCQTKVFTADSANPSRIFGLFPESILLLSDDGYMETADSDGQFHNIDDLSHWTVTGSC